MNESQILWDFLVQRMTQHKLIKPYVRQELELLPVVIEMQLRGIAVDQSLFDIAEQKLQKKTSELVRHTQIS